MPSSYLQIWIQRQISSGTFPPNREDWYIKNGLNDSEMALEERFDRFVQAQREEGAFYYESFKNIDFQRYELNVTLANQSPCLTEVVAFHNDNTDITSNASGHGKHVIYFTGMGTLYQDCFTDITEAVRTTGATYYGFEYPGMSRLGGEVLEVNDLVNTGLAVTNDLLRKGIPIDDILFQGDSFGAAVAKKISNLFKEQRGVEIRCILNNTFSTFQAAVQNVMSQSAWTSPFTSLVSPVLRYTGWDIRPGDTYGLDTPYQVHVNHIGDLTLGGGTLAALVDRNRQLPDFIDPCPDEFINSRDSYDNMHWAQISADGESYLAAKYGRNDKGQVDTHLANLLYMQYPDGQSVYKALICAYIQDSNAYIKLHPQVISLDQLPQPLGSETVSLYDLLVPSTTRYLGFFSQPTPQVIETNHPEEEHLIKPTK
ncbi:Dot/Icm T4SS effector alpha/beta hydrolase [uncultured Legionella sp.]|uniref:Dot/Icm T4SS effector alpha/beta hydrolase n=1 Tax=uncultured Legionella sp. TaxID=210934 RepID=UPI00262F088F|nr:Dot/Icm T4SS effector alpha/beta hydrolase [uncultured Legionella sp.]